MPPTEHRRTIACALLGLCLALLIAPQTAPAQDDARPDPATRTVNDSVVWIEDLSELLRPLRDESHRPLTLRGNENGGGGGLYFDDDEPIFDPVEIDALSDIVEEALDGAGVDSDLVSLQIVGSARLLCRAPKSARPIVRRRRLARRATVL